MTEPSSPTDQFGQCPVLNCDFQVTPEDLPERPALTPTLGEQAKAIITLLADTAEEIAVAGMFMHHLTDHSTAEFMDTITVQRDLLESGGVVDQSDRIAELEKHLAQVLEHNSVLQDLVNTYGEGAKARLR